MCAINFWAVNAAAFTPDFQRFTTERIGVPPSAHDVTIRSSRVRPTSKVFTLHRQMCDCTSLIGARDAEERADEASAEDWLGWLRDLPDHVPHLSRIAVLRTWDPDYVSSEPEQAKGIRIGEVDEAVLRDIRDETLLTIDYPRPV